MHCLILPIMNIPAPPLLNYPVASLLFIFYFLGFGRKGWYYWPNGRSNSRPQDTQRACSTGTTSGRFFYGMQTINHYRFCYWIILLRLTNAYFFYFPWIHQVEELVAKHFGSSLDDSIENGQVNNKSQNT